MKINKFKIVGIITTLLIGSGLLSLFIIQKHDVKQTISNTPINNISQTLGDEIFSLTDLSTTRSNSDFNDRQRLSNETVPYNTTSNYGIYKTGELPNGKWILEVPIYDLENDQIKAIHDVIPDWRDKQKSFNSSQITQTIIFDVINNTFNPIVPGFEKSKVLMSDSNSIEIVSLNNGRLILTDETFKNQNSLLESTGLSDVYFLNIFNNINEPNIVWVEASNEDSRVEFQGYNFYKVSISKDQQNNKTNVDIQETISTSPLTNTLYQKEAQQAPFDYLTDQIKNSLNGGTTDSIEDEVSLDDQGEDQDKEGFIKTNVFYLGNNSFFINLSERKEYYWKVSITDGIQKAEFLNDINLINDYSVFPTCNGNRHECVIIDFESSIYYIINLDNNTVVKRNLPEKFNQIKLSGIISSAQASPGNINMLFKYYGDVPVLWYLGTNYSF